MKNFFVLFILLIFHSKFFSQICVLDAWVICGGYENVTVEANIEKFDNSMGNKKVYAWVKYKHDDKIVKLKSGKVKTIKGGKTLYYIILDCKNKNFVNEKTINYNGNGNVLNSYSGDIGNHKIAPDSTMEKVYDYACKCE
jgi:hypothetical protein